MNELDIDRGKEWASSIELMQGLFPKWNVTMEQLGAWKSEFSVWNPEWFREALTVVYHRYNSDNPKPKWVKEAFREVKAGHQGVPLDESGSADVHRINATIQKEQEEAIAIRDRNRAYEEVGEWEEDERKEIATEFHNRFFMLSRRIDLNNFTTWSKTFCQQIHAYRAIRGVLRQYEPIVKKT